MEENKVLTRLLEQTKSHLVNFWDVFSQQVINGEASLFFGAGMSRNSGFPSWKEILQPCAEDLNLSLDNETDLYAVAQFYANKFAETDLRRKISEKINTIARSNNILESLLDVGFNSIWTVNYDKLIEQGLTNRGIPNNVIISDKNLSNINKYDKVNIYKLNGDISMPDEMIVTKDDYEKYKKKHKLFLTFLKKEFVANTFLFVGYSFTDDIVLSTLNDINEYLGKTGNSHYALMMVDENTDVRFEYFVDDLKKRYGITCICVTKEQILMIINMINERIREKKVFISGAYDKVGDSVDKFADKLSYELVCRLLQSGYRISTGVGRRLGTFVTGYAHQYLAEKKTAINPAKYLSMRPFPFHIELNDEIKIKYRTIMQRDCSAAIFLFGQSAQTYNDGSDDKIKHYCKGVWMEYTVAKNLGHIIIPVGSTGFESEVIWDEVKKHINEYPYLSKKIDILKTETNPEKLAEIIVSILDEVSKNRRIQQQ
jgi:hypothetical protein